MSAEVMQSRDSGHSRFWMLRPLFLCKGHKEIFLLGAKQDPGWGMGVLDQGLDPPPSQLCLEVRVLHCQVHWALWASAGQGSLTRATRLPCCSTGQASGQHPAGAPAWGPPKGASPPLLLSGSLWHQLSCEANPGSICRPVQRDR